MKALHQAALLLSAYLFSPHDADAVIIGDEVCITNYIMDQFCIKLGHFIDDSSTMTLANPEEHSFHCLLDVGQCKDSGYVVLTDKDEETDMHCIGYRLEDTAAVLEAGFAAGQKGYCTGCTGDSTMPDKGWQATVKGTVKELGDGSAGPAGAPLLENIVIVDAGTECATTMPAPVCMAPPAEPDNTIDAPVDVGDGSPQSCPDTLDKMKVIDDKATLYLAMVPSNPPGSGNGILCARLEAENDGWIGLGFSPNALMFGSNAVVGIPEDDSVLKYDLAYLATAMDESKQTLRDVSCGQEGGKVIMEFTKLLLEAGEIPIKEEGTNYFLHSRGDASLGYHSNGHSSFAVNFAELADSDIAELKVGDEVCTTNYIMDQYCIGLGYFLDDSSTMTLVNPEYHSFHCLLDVPLCINSGYAVLGDKDAETGIHCLGFRIDGTAAVLAAGLAAGQQGGCTDCTGDSSKPTHGFRATVKGTVKQLGDGTDGITGTPILENVQVLDDGVVCETSTVSPICLASTVAPAPETPTAPARDCTKQMCEETLSPDYLMKYQINVPSDTTTEVCTGCTISMELTYNDEAWVSIAFSTDGNMIGSEAVIGNPGDGSVLKYSLGAKDPSGVVPFRQDQQTLSDTSVEVMGGQTIVKFTKIMKEPGEIVITTGDNGFLWAYGTGNALGYHKARASFALNLSSGASEVVATPNKAAWLAHGIMAFLAWGVFVPFAVQSSLLRSFLPSGPLWFNLHRAFNTTAFTFTIIFFAIAVAFSNKEGGSNAAHFDDNHGKMGLAMFIISFSQVAGGLFRPHVADAPEDKTPARKGWEVGHRMFGVVLLACGFWQMREGINLFSAKYSVSESNEDNLAIAYWVWIGVMSAVIVIGGFLKLRKSGAEDDTNNDHAPLANDDDAEAP